MPDFRPVSFCLSTQTQINKDPWTPAARFPDLSTSRLDGGDLDRPFWGIRTPATGRAKVYYNVFDESGLVARITLRLRARGAPY